MTFSVTFEKQSNNKADTVVVGVFEGNQLSDSAASFDKAHDGIIQKNVEVAKNFKGKLGQTITISLSGKGPVRAVICGLGKLEELDNIAYETLGGKLWGVLKPLSAEKIELYVKGFENTQNSETAKVAAHIALGMKLKSYTFNKYKSAKADTQNIEIQNINIITDAFDPATKIYNDLSQVADGVFLARDLVNEPPNTLYPESYVERLTKELKPLGVEIEILDEKKMSKMGFGALLAVGQGSIRESRVAVMRWNGGEKSKKGARAPIAFVGKGVTFDTGGISLKPGAEMDLMKMDMGGSAAVVGLMKAIAARKAKANIIGIIGLVENMPSDRAYRPGDVITSHAGKTIEVLNTDAEGRLVLADALTYIQETYNPEVIIDLATLTGAIMVALGFEYCGAFANHDDLWDKLNDASKNTGEKFWRMPLDAAYRKEMESEIADLKNLGSLGRYGGACSAAGFLEHFINEDTQWAHIDIAGTAWWKTDKDTTPKGGTGFPVRALNDLIVNHFEEK